MRRRGHWAGAVWCLSLCLLALALSCAAPGAARAQEELTGPEAERTGPGLLRSPVLTIDPDLLFEESLFGQRILAEVEAQKVALAAENRQIEAELTAEEQSLTDRRPGMEVEAFRAEAEAFDAKVQAIRRERDAAERALTEIEERGREAFLTAAQPILARLMFQRGAAVIIDRRSVFLGFGAIDVTEAAVAAVDLALGDGAADPEAE